MVKKQKTEEIVRAIPIDYIKLVDDMSDEAFRFCADQLYPIWNYRILQKEDVRRIDLKEQLLKLNSIVPKKDGKKQGALNYYLFVLKLYFDSYLKCKEGSTAEKYRKRAMELMESALSDNGTIEDVEDLVQIYIALFRTLSNRFNEIEKYVAVDLTFDVFKEDADMLKKICVNKNLVPNGIVEKQGLFETVFRIEGGKKEAIAVAYVNNVVFLCRCLQNRGAFDMEEE